MVIPPVIMFDISSIILLFFCALKTFLLSKFVFF